MITHYLGMKTMPLDKEGIVKGRGTKEPEAAAGPKSFLAVSGRRLQTRLYSLENNLTATIFKHTFS